MEMVTKLKVDEINKEIDNIVLAMSILCIQSIISYLKMEKCMWSGSNREMSQCLHMKLTQVF